MGSRNILLHRKGAGPGAVALRLVFIGMVFLGHGFEMGLSVVELRRQAHARQAGTGYAGRGRGPEAKALRRRTRTETGSGARGRRGPRSGADLQTSCQCFTFKPAGGRREEVNSAPSSRKRCRPMAGDEKAGCEGEPRGTIAGRPSPGNPGSVAPCGQIESQNAIGTKPLRRAVTRSGAGPRRRGEARGELGRSAARPSRAEDAAPGPVSSAAPGRAVAR